MYKVIDGHKYDTETAREQANWSNMADCGNFAYCEETLYRTKNGLYFLHGEGGPMSRYARTINQNEWGWGEMIQPLSEDTAKKWVEEHCSGEAYERIFGDPEEDAGTRKLTVMLTAKDAEKLEALKKETGWTYTEMISQWIRNA